MIVELSHLRNEDGASSLNHPQKQLLLLAKPDNGRDEVAVIQIEPATTMASKVQALNAWFQTIDRKLSSVADRLHAIESNLKQEFVNSPSVLVDLSQIMYRFSELKQSVDEVRKAMEQASNVKNIDASSGVVQSNAVGDVPLSESSQTKTMPAELICNLDLEDPQQTDLLIAVSNQFPNNQRTSKDLLCNSGRFVPHEGLLKI